MVRNFILTTRPNTSTDEWQGLKKTIYIQHMLNRKARIAATASQQTKTDAVADKKDFISLGGWVNEEKAVQPPEDVF